MSAIRLGTSAATASKSPLQIGRRRCSQAGNMKWKVISERITAGESLGVEGAEAGKNRREGIAWACVCVCADLL